MITWERARLIVDRELREEWSAAYTGLTFWVAEWGYADAESFQVPYGARESMVDGDGSSGTVGDLFALVDRETGELSFHAWCDGGFLDRLSAMEPVGSGHPPD